MNSRIHYILLLAICSLVFTSCLKDEVESESYYFTDADYNELTKTLNIPNSPVDYTVELPTHFISNSSIRNPINSSMATLGRVLFYDKKLSANNTVSCASCHFQEFAFSDTKDLSEGFDGLETRRNAFALGAVASFESTYGSSNSFGSNNIFWDNRASSVEEQVHETIENPIEMGMDMDELADKLNKEEYYKILFKNTFGDDRINAGNIAIAIQEFVNSLITFESPFDEGMASAQFNEFNNFPNYTNQENIGKSIFISNCSSCHGTNMITVSENAANNGLDAYYTDKGIGELTGAQSLNGVFKVPLLRNVELTAPYMHDGRFDSLEEVVEHYNSGIANHNNLHNKLRNGNQPIQLNLDTSEKDALVAFLKTLTDDKFTTYKKYSDPFK